MRNRSYRATRFQLLLSRANAAFVFLRTDAGAQTETVILGECSSEDEAVAYFDARVAFFCESLGISADELVKG